MLIVSNFRKCCPQNPPDEKSVEKCRVMQLERNKLNCACAMLSIRMVATTQGRDPGVVLDSPLKSLLGYHGSQKVSTMLSITSNVLTESKPENMFLLLSKTLMHLLSTLCDSGLHYLRRT